MPAPVIDIAEARAAREHVAVDPLYPPGGDAEQARIYGINTTDLVEACAVIEAYSMPQRWDDAGAGVYDVNGLGMDSRHIHAGLNAATMAAHTAMRPHTRVWQMNPNLPQCPVAWFWFLPLGGAEALTLVDLPEYPMICMLHFALLKGGSVFVRGDSDAATDRAITMLNTALAAYAGRA